MKVSMILLFVLALSLQSFASPLVFKLTKDIDSPDEYVELATIPAAKYQRVRVHVASSSPVFNASIGAVEAGEVLFLSGDSATVRSNAFRLNFLIDVPPPSMRISVMGKGTFKVFVWAAE